MTSKNDLRFFDPQIEVKKKAVGERLQFIPKTRIPIPSEIEISESEYVIENVVFAQEVIQILNTKKNL